MKSEKNMENLEKNKNLKPSMEKFQKLGIKKNLLQVLEEQNFSKPSEIQEKTISLGIKGKDIIAGSATGTGKTLAFGAGIIQNSEKGKGIQALIIAPTRELAEQVSKALKKFSKYKPLEIVAIFGGVSIDPQIRALKTADIVVGTPGRILDHLERRTLELFELKTLVLDEADRLLDMGFIDDVDKIIGQTPIKRQTMLFSATIGADMIYLSEKYMKDPVEVSAVAQVDPTKLKQVYYDVPDAGKFSLLVHLLKTEKGGPVMVFCNTRRNVDFVAKNLMFSQIDALPIHGGFSQEKRTRVMENFKKQKAYVLVSTDVAARGLDIKGVSHVYNYDIPKDPKEYLHRIGRTARAGKEGKAISILASRDYQNFTAVLKTNEVKIMNMKTPDYKRVRIRWKESAPSRGPRGPRRGAPRGFRSGDRPRAQRYRPGQRRPSTRSHTQQRPSTRPHSSQRPSTRPHSHSRKGSSKRH